MRIILAGIIGRYPYGGVAWCSLMYLLGLRALGHEVWYLEDTGECNYDPVANTLAMEPGYATRFIDSTLRPYGFGDRWCYIDVHGEYHGISRTRWTALCRQAEVFLILSGGCWFWRDEYVSIPHCAFIDSDPAFTQIDIARRGDAHAAFFRRFDRLFTFGRNVGTSQCAVPDCGLRWVPTWQPIFMDEWQPLLEVPRRCFTTVMTWRIESFADIGGNKNVEFMKILDLPKRSPVALELAVNGPIKFLEAHGWRCVNAFEVSRDVEEYRRYLRSSMGEISVAKNTYVSTNSGWFSDRTECYLAAGRPAIVQDTGFSGHVPTGEGLFAFEDADAAHDALEQIVLDFPRHSRRAREIAAAHFSSAVVLPALLEALLSSGSP